MITLIGTSHIAQESVNSIRKTVEKVNPDIIAIEIDEKRLFALLEGKREHGRGILVNLLSQAQKYFGGKTGIFPGKEMLTAFKIGNEKKVPIALIDQKINITLGKFREIPRKEKLKLFLALLSVFVPLPGKKKIDLKKVPDDEIIFEAVSQFRRIFPKLYQILVVERDQIMAMNLIKLNEDYKNILVFIGAGHVEGMKKILKENEIEVA